MSEHAAEKDVPDSPAGIEEFDRNDHLALVFDTTDTQVWLGASGTRETCEWWTTSEHAALAPGEHVVIARRVTPPAVGRVCPECQQGKHQNCDGTAWDDAADAPGPCGCPDGSHR